MGRHFQAEQGKYNAEVPALQQEVSRLTAEMAKAKQPAGNAVQRAVSDLTPEEIAIQRSYLAYHAPALAER